MDSTIDFLQVFGRLHPMLVHFPIALLVLGGLLELFRRRDTPSSTALFCVLLGATGALVAAWAGWEFAEHDGPGPSRTMWFHRWGGVTVAGLAFVTAVTGLVARKGTQPKAGALFRGGAILSMLLVGFVAHQGGKSVWGDGFVFELLLKGSDENGDGQEPEGNGSGAATTSAAGGGGTTAEPVGEGAFPVVDVAASSSASEPENGTGGSVPATPIVPAEVFAKVDYATQIQPILEASCYRCHGPKRRPKAGLRLSDMADVFAGAQEDWVIQPGDAAASLVYQRVTLPPDHEDFMPPEGDPLTPGEVALLRDWIDEGAEWTELPAEPGESEEVGQAETEPAPVAATLAPVELDEAQRVARDAVLDQLRERGAYAGRIAQDTDEVEVNLGLAAIKDDQALDSLKGLETTLVSLDLSRSSVTDAGLVKLESFPRLRRLRLDHTAIGDEGLKSVARLTSLEYLNLVGTSVTDTGLGALVGLKRLEKIYLWQTEVTDGGAEQLADALPEVDVVRDTYRPLVVEAADTQDEDAVETERSAACCDAAAAAGRDCDHPCCVEAAASGEVCPKCSA